MANPTTLLELATQNLDVAKASQIQALKALTVTDKNLAQARKDLTAVTDNIGSLEKKVATIRTGLATIPTRADGEALLIALEKKTVELRAQQAALLSLEENVATLEAVRKQQNEALSQVSAATVKVEANVVAAKKASDRQRDAKAKLADAPLETLQAEATDALKAIPTTAPHPAAEARIAKDIPAELLSRARHRREVAANRITAPRQLLEIAEGLGDGRFAAHFRRLEADFEDYVAHAKDRFEQALARLASVADNTNCPLTDEQNARIADTDLVTKGKIAINKEGDRDDNAVILHAKQLALDIAVLKARDADIDADPAADGDVKNATKDLKDAQKPYDDAVTAFDAAAQQDLDLWEAAVPDSTWRLLDDLQEADATLNALITFDPAKHLAELATAELDWVNAIIAKEKAARATQFLDGEVAAHAAALAYQQDSAARRKFSALRGDS